MNFQGNWLTKCGFKATIEKMVANNWIGVVEIPTIQKCGEEMMKIPTSWDLHGDHAVYGLNLKDRIVKESDSLTETNE